MDYAMKSLSLLSPSSLSKCVTASASRTQQLLSGGTPRPRPFRVSAADRGVRKGIVADGLQDLIDKAMESLHVSHYTSLVLDEDGTEVDGEEFFQTLPDNATLMLLEEGQKWTPPQSAPPRMHHRDRRLQHRKDVARLTFDLYKNNPKDFIGCVNMKVTLYGVYTVSYDLRCYAAKNILKEALRWALFSMQTTGHVLLGSSCYIEQLLEEEARVDAGLPALPRSGKVAQLQNVLLGRTGL